MITCKVFSKIPIEKEKFGRDLMAVLMSGYEDVGATIITIVEEKHQEVVPRFGKGGIIVTNQNGEMVGDVKQWMEFKIWLRLDEEKLQVLSIVDEQIFKGLKKEETQEEMVH